MTKFDKDTSLVKMFESYGILNKNFSGMDFSLEAINLFGVERADFSYENLERADFSHSNLEGADFSHSDLKGASFHQCNLTGVDFSNANLFGVDFTGSNVRDAKLTIKNLKAENLSSFEASNFVSKSSDGSIRFFNSGAASNRFFLFLQGPGTPFFDRLASAVRRAGIGTCRINFCGGDEAFDTSSNSVRFTENREDLASFYLALYSQMNVTDVVMFQDTSQLHRDAIVVARQIGIKIYVFDEGYLRPDWVTLEEGGVNAFSSLPKSPAYYKELAKKVPRRIVSRRTNYSQWTRVFQNVIYNSSSLTDRKKFPYYKQGKNNNVIQEYLGFIKRHSLLPQKALLAHNAIKKLLNQSSDFYTYVLQVESDNKIKFHSPYTSSQQASEEVLRSFSEFSPSDSFLIIKNHPLDSGVSGHKKWIKDLSKYFNVSDRVVFLDAGHLPTLLSHSRGNIIVNSTTGMSSLFHQCPTIALGSAIYDMPGLTFQGSLDNFWREAKKPDRELFMAFRDVIIYKTQINGNYYTKMGVEMAVEGSLKRFGITIDRAKSTDKTVSPSNHNFFLQLSTT